MEYAQRLSSQSSGPADFGGRTNPGSPAIVAGSSAAARSRGVAQIEAAGLRLADAVSVEEAVTRIDRQAATSAVWVELDCDQGAPLDDLLDRIDRDAEAGTYAAIVAASAALLDPVAARLTRGKVDILIDGDGGERVAALALALALPQPGGRLSDVASDNSAARLRQLSDEVGRIAATLARLSGGLEGGPAHAVQPVPAPVEPPVEISRDLLRAVIRARRLRARYFTDELFADPAWDMLLDLTQAEVAQIRVPVSSLCIAAAVPATTALRWIKTLTDSGMLLRRAHPHDGRRVFVELAPTTSVAMRSYFSEVGRVLGI